LDAEEFTETSGRIRSGELHAIHSRRVAGLRGSRDEPLWESPNVIFYKSKIEPRLLVEAAENLIQTDRA
jgi:hypothetical protein